MKRLTPLDTSFLQIETRETPMHVGSLHIYKKPANAEKDFLQNLYQSFANVTEYAPPFNLKLKFPPFKAGLPVLVEDKNFDLDYHVRHSALPHPGTMEQLMTLVSRLHGSLLDRSRPLWEFNLIEGLQGNRFALYFKMHHCTIDGVGGMKMLEATLSKSPSISNIRPPWESKGSTPKKSRPQLDLSARLSKTWSSLKSSAEIVPELVTTFAGMGRDSFGNQNPVVPLPFQAPKSALNIDITAQRRFAVITVSLNDVKEVGKKANATVNDIVMALCAGALRRYLEERKSLPEKPLTAFVPISVRPKDGGSTGNQISNILCNLGTHISDPKERLQLIKASASEGKKIQNELSKKAIQNYAVFSGTPAMLVQVMHLSHFVNPAFNLVISNVPGPRTPMYLNGALLEANYPVSALFERQAVNITVTSYQNSLDFGFIACRDALTDVGKLRDYLKDELTLLQKLFL